VLLLLVCDLASCCWTHQGVWARNASNRQLNTMAGLNFNLLDQLAFYGAYHNNKWNQASTHTVLAPARTGHCSQTRSSSMSSGWTHSPNVNLLLNASLHPNPDQLYLQLIHFIFVPAIVWSAGVWLASSGPLVQPPQALSAAAAALPAWLSSG